MRSTANPLDVMLTQMVERMQSFVQLGSIDLFAMAALPSTPVEPAAQRPMTSTSGITTDHLMVGPSHWFDGGMKVESLKKLLEHGSEVGG